MLISCSIKVSGRVQGVGFRYHTRNKATELGVTGFVKNQMDGSVYIEVEGEESAVTEFIDWCRVGPRWARVDGTEVGHISARNFSVFEIT